MRPPRLTTLAACALTSALALLAVTGCSSSSAAAGKKSSSAASGASSASSAASNASPAVAQNTLPAASAIANDVAKRPSVAVTKCVASDGGWTASGTAKNSGTGDATYAITIFFTNAHATVQDYATTSVTVPAGKSVDWSAAKKFAASTPTNCVLRGVG
jgi:hypothetical protein